MSSSPSYPRLYVGEYAQEFKRRILSPIVEVYDKNLYSILRHLTRVTSEVIVLEDISSLSSYTLLIHFLENTSNRIILLATQDVVDVRLLSVVPTLYRLKKNINSKLLSLTTGVELLRAGRDLGDIVKQSPVTGYYSSLLSTHGVPLTYLTVFENPK